VLLFVERSRVESGRVSEQREPSSRKDLGKEKTERVGKKLDLQGEREKKF